MGKPGMCFRGRGCFPARRQGSGLFTPEAFRAYWQLWKLFRGCETLQTAQGNASTFK